MTIRGKAVLCLRIHFPEEVKNITRASKFFPEQQLWFFTFPTKFFRQVDDEYLNILCQHESGEDNFHFFHIPFLFIKAHRELFDIRKNGEFFDLHISSRPADKFSERRSHGRIDFAQYKMS